MTTARREGTGELLLTGGLLVLYMSLRGTARALGALESVVTLSGDRAPGDEAVGRDDRVDHACGTGASVVIAITARSLPRRRAADGPTAAAEMFTPCSPNAVPTRPIMPGTSW